METPHDTPGRVRTWPSGWSPVGIVAGLALIFFGAGATVDFLLGGGLHNPRQGGAPFLALLGALAVGVYGILPWVRRRPGIRVGPAALRLGEEEWPWPRVRALRLLRGSVGLWPRPVLALGLALEAEDGSVEWVERSATHVDVPVRWLERALAATPGTPPVTVTDSAVLPDRWGSRPPLAYGLLSPLVPVVLLALPPLWGIWYWSRRPSVDTALLTTLAGWVVLCGVLYLAGVRAALRVMPEELYRLAGGTLQVTRTVRVDEPSAGRRGSRGRPSYRSEVRRIDLAGVTDVGRDGDGQLVLRGHDGPLVALPTDRLGVDAAELEERVRAASAAARAGRRRGR